MTARTEDLTAMIEANRLEVRTLIEGLRDEDLDKVADVGWTVRLLAGHLSGTPQGNIFVLKRLSNGRSATVPGFLSWVGPVRNWLGNRKYKSATPASMLENIDKTSAELSAFVGRLTDAQLDGRGTVLGIGELSTEEFLRRLPAHTDEHGASIREVVGEPAATA